MAAKRDQLGMLEKLWYWAKELQLKQDEIRKEFLLSETCLKERPATRQQKVAKLEY
jgi:hypothetical protein